MSRSFDELIKSPLWPTAGAPDVNSMMAATRVQMLLAAGNYGSHEDYLMDALGYTRDEAETIVANCLAESDLD